jgi:ADP-heptose:LPS heptosyltransferase
MNSTITHPIKKILVLRPDRLGDVILTLPVVRNLKEAYPDASITYLCTHYTSQILESYSLIDKLIIYDRDQTHKGFRKILSLAKELSEYNFDLAVHLLPRYPLALATYLAQIKYTIGTGFRWYSFLFTHRQYDHRKYNQYHEAEYNLRLLSKISIDSTYHPDVYSHFKFSSELQEGVQNIISDRFRGKSFIVLHPGSGGSSIDWPLSHYTQLIQYLNEWGQFAVGVTGVEREREFLNPLYKADVDFIDLVGTFDLNELAIFLKNARLFLSNSTGPLHLAVAMGTKVLGLYPNSPGLGPGRWGPIGQDELSYLTPEIDQSKSPTDPVNNDMEKITPQIVYDRIKILLSE